MPVGPQRQDLKKYFPGKRRLNYHLFPIPDLGLFYVKNPKAGCSTILLWLDRMYTGDHAFLPENIHTDHRLPRPRDLGWEKLAPMLGGEAFVFSFVRDPLRRFESAYRDKVTVPGLWRDDVRATLGLSAEPDDEVSFEQFLTAVEQQDPIAQMDPHWRPQHVNLMHPVVQYDHIGRLETFDADLTKIRELAGLPDAPPEVRNATARSGASVYDGRPDLVRRVQDLYATDFELYDY